MLKTNKPKFENYVKSILETAMYETLMDSFSKSGDNLIDSYVEKSIDNAAKKMARKFADKAAIPLTDAIDTHIKAAGININISPAALTLSNTAGPVTGTITITPTTSKIEII